MKLLPCFWHGWGGGTVTDPWAALPSRGKYRVVYADPPWSFETWSHRGQGKGASQHYDVMDMAAIKALPVGDLAAPDAALLMWVVQPMFPEALELIRAWGFTYKTVGYIWVKTKPQPAPFLFFDEAWSDGLVRKGLGYHTRSGSEQCWLATRGDGYERLSQGEAQVVHADIRQHSRKPDEIADSIVRLTEGPRVELFARTRRAGFDGWGNQIEKFGPVSVQPAAVPDEVPEAGVCLPVAAAPRVERQAADSADDAFEDIPAFLKRDPVTNALTGVA